MTVEPILMNDRALDRRARKRLASYQAMRRLLLAIAIIGVFIVLLFGQSLFPPETFVHETLEMIGILLIFLGIVGRLWSTLYIGGRKSSEVITGGPYSMTRNPLYVFSSIAAAGVGAQTGSIVVTLCFGLLCAAAFHVVILREERFLIEKFGAPYRAYIARVPRFFPNPALYYDGDTHGFRPRRLLATLLDGLVFLIALPVFEVIDFAQTSGVLPVLFRLP